jgi:hypothetical protein
MTDDPTPLPLDADEAPDVRNDPVPELPDTTNPDADDGSVTHTEGEPT